MQSVQRHFGKYMKRSADEQQISVLLKDFEDADQLLARVRTLSLVPYSHETQHFRLTSVTIDN